MMKKLVSLLLSITLLCIALPALADLDTAFEAGNLKLTETGSVYTPAVSDFDLTDDMLAVLAELAPDLDVAATLKDALTGGPPTVLSLAPSGNAAILELAGYGICCSEGKYHIIYPGATWGVEDTYSNRKDFFMRFAGKYHTSIDDYSGVIWSPDGRYVAISNMYVLFGSAKVGILAPMIIDVSTGEMILLDALPVDKDFRQTVSAACFSRDVKYLYYVLYGRFEDARVRLCRCDLTTGETEVLLKTEERAFIPPLQELADGSLLLNDNNQTRINEFGSVFHFAEKDGEWILEHIEGTATTRCASPFRLFYSEKSGYAITLDSTLLGRAYSFQVLRPGEDFAGLDRYLCLSEEKDEVISLTGAELEDAATAAQDLCKDIEPKARENVFNALPFRCIEHAVMSPDGNYLLAVTVSTDGPMAEYTRDLCLIRLTDLAVRRVDGPDAGSITKGAYLSLRRAFEWNTDTLVIVTESGIKTYQFE